VGEHDVDRRAFIGMAGAGVGTMLAAPDTALAALPGESDRGLAHTFLVEETLLNGAVAPDVPTVAGWDTNKLFNQAAATMLWSARVQKATRKERKTDEFRRAVDARLDGMLRTVWATALELDALEGDALLETEEMILEDPGLLDEARLKFTIRALEHDMSMDAVKFVDRGFERTMWQIRHRGLASVRDDLIAKLDKAAKREGVDWRAEALRGADAPFVSASLPNSTDHESARSDPESMDYSELTDRARRQSTTGAVMLILGILWMAGPQIIFGGICFGPPLIIVGIVKLVAAGKKRRRAEEIRGVYRALESE